MNVPVDFSQKFSNDNGPHGFCINLNYQPQNETVVKKCILNRCICRIYHLRGLSCPIPHYNKQCIRCMLNVIVKSGGPKILNGLQHARRKLFRERRPRKQTQPNKITESDLSLFQLRMPHNRTSITRIRRGYLDEARQIVRREIFVAVQQRYKSQMAERIEASLYHFDYFAQSILEHYMRQQHTFNVHYNCSQILESLVKPMLQT